MLWILFAIVAFAFSVGVLRLAGRRLITLHPFCTRCGQDVLGFYPLQPCPECRSNHARYGKSESVRTALAVAGGVALVAAASAGMGISRSTESVFDRADRTQNWHAFREAFESGVADDADITGFLDSYAEHVSNANENDRDQLGWSIESIWKGAPGHREHIITTLLDFEHRAWRTDDGLVVIAGGVTRTTDGGFTPSVTDGAVTYHGERDWFDRLGRRVTLVDVEFSGFRWDLECPNRYEYCEPLSLIEHWGFSRCYWFKPSDLTTIDVPDEIELTWRIEVGGGVDHLSWEPHITPEGVHLVRERVRIEPDLPSLEAHWARLPELLVQRINGVRITDAQVTARRNGMDLSFVLHGETLPKNGQPSVTWVTHRGRWGFSILDFLHDGRWTMSRSVDRGDPYQMPAIASFAMKCRLNTPGSDRDHGWDPPWESDWQHQLWYWHWVRDVPVTFLEQ